MCGREKCSHTHKVFTSGLFQEMLNQDAVNDGQETQATIHFKYVSLVSSKVKVCLIIRENMSC